MTKLIDNSCPTVKEVKPLVQSSQTVGYLYSAANNAEHLQKQRAEIEADAATQGNHIEIWVEDYGGRPRTGLGLLTEKVREGKVDRVYVAHANRLNRDSQVFMGILNTFTENGVSVWSASQGALDLNFSTAVHATQALPE